MAGVALQYVLNKYFRGNNKKIKKEFLRTFILMPASLIALKKEPVFLALVFLAFLLL